MAPYIISHISPYYSFIFAAAYLPVNVNNALPDTIGEKNSVSFFWKGGACMISKTPQFTPEYKREPTVSITMVEIKDIYSQIARGAWARPLEL